MLTSKNAYELSSTYSSFLFFLRDRLHELYILGTANVCINLEKKQEEQNMKNE